MKSTLWKQFQRSPLLQGCFGMVLSLVVLGTLRFYSNIAEALQQHNGPREVLKVGFLPVTCHLTCPVTDYATRTSKFARFESWRFMDFPTLCEAFKSGRLQASFILAPLAMKLVEEGVPCKIVYLGHRDGSTLIVPKNSKAKSLRDLKGCTLAIPSFTSNQYLVLRRRMEQEGMQPNDIKFVQMAPPDMPAALAAHAIDAFFVGEPNPGKAEMMGIGRPLYYAKDLWPGFVSCVLVVSDKLIHSNPMLVADLVRGIADSGAWADKHRIEAAEVVAPYYRQDPKLLRYVLTTPPDRVSYSMLTPTDKDMEDIMDEAVKVGVLKHKLPLSAFLDRSFIPKHIVPIKITPPPTTAQAG
ncbi:MAG TPA: ABC transporter substrate-binding protein [Chthonomonas sp.]|uniref:ABC transporter substrate-binding protein n=1 Tax=Chthonomonas sp. TaxID=2282153 RepID=UPI002B4B88FB|nr:ABC transporter substrate-binding protein [Chthonomonas sp.]HLI49505.1 ABC transporter substrate-binding protein [Chthonomonas sp.]